MIEDLSSSISSDIASGGTMRLNGNSTESANENDEMLKTENDGVAERVSDLERRLLKQNDELECLTATLAEALRRITVLEGAKFGAHHQHLNNVPSSAPCTPARNGSSCSSNTKEARLRHANYSPPTTTTPSIKSNLLENRRSFGSGLPQRRAAHYQSTGSLHSDSQSSSSVSPIPSPSPRATPQPLTRRPPVSVPIQAAANATNLHKRWSSTGDFNQTIASPQSK